jgi:hypothetical protein
MAAMLMTGIDMEKTYDKRRVKKGEMGRRQHSIPVESQRSAKDATERRAKQNGIPMVEAGGEGLAPERKIRPAAWNSQAGSKFGLAAGGC